jgi:hypothetical protein
MQQEGQWVRVPLGPLAGMRPWFLFPVYALGALRADREGGGPSVEGEEAVLHVIERIVAPLGLRVDATSPWVDARLPEALGCRPDLLAPLSDSASPLALPVRAATLPTASPTPLGVRGGSPSGLAIHLRLPLAGVGSVSPVEAIGAEIPGQGVVAVAARQRVPAIASAELVRPRLTGERVVLV